MRTSLRGFLNSRIHVDSLATTSYVDQVRPNLTEPIPTIVQNRPSTDQVTREEITKVRDEMQKVRVLHAETGLNQTKSLLEALSLNSKVKTIEGRIKHIRDKADPAHNTAVQTQSLVAGLQPQVQSNKKKKRNAARRARTFYPEGKGNTPGVTPLMSGLSTQLGKEEPPPTAVASS
jgi:FKBP-type peptidyl-prolyl cis-trans isomerase